MNDREPSFRDAVKELTSAARRQTGKPPSPEELIAYQDGTLPEADRGRVQNQLALLPESAQTLLDLVLLSKMESPEQGAEVEGYVPDWAHLKARLKADEPTVSEARTESATAHVRRWQVWALAACLPLLLGLGGLVWLQERELAEHSRPRINVHQVHLSPLAQQQQRVGSGAQVVTLPASGNHLLLILNIGDRGVFSDYRIEISEAALAGGRLLWRTDGLVSSAYGTFNLEISRNFLGPGDYRLRLYGLGGDREEVLADYWVRFVVE